MTRFTHVLILAIVLLTLRPSSMVAAELVMFEEAGCPWCRRWHAEVGPGYGKSPEGQRAPLRLVDVHRSRPQDLTFIKKIQVTPTFVLIEGGHEMGRITGYPGADFFWAQLGQMLDRIPPVKDSATRCPSSARDALSVGNSC